MIPDAIIDALLDPATYPHRPPSVRLVQTHISCVFLAGTEVFKVKKPVRFSFLDFSTLTKRRHYCEEEVRLNRRLTPADVYRGVVAITRHGAGYSVGGDGEVVEYAVHMRHLPDDRLLGALVTRGEADAALMAAIAQKMARFHASAASTPTIALTDPVETVRRTLTENVAALRASASLFDGTADVDILERLLASALGRIAETLRARQRAGRVRECHGDLRPDHICSIDGLPIFDCVEFSPAIRHCDVASEIAFLAVELEFLDAAPLADALVDAYVAASDDHDLRRLVPFFRAYRAHIRAMVAALTASEGEIAAAERTRLGDDCRRHLDLVERNAWRAHPPMIVAIAGRSGTGKSTLARALAPRIGYAWIRSDVVRKRLAGLAPLDRPRDASAAEQLYAAPRTAELYDALAAEAEVLLARDRGAIVDATFLQRRHRAPLQAAAARRGVPLLWIVCGADDATVHARLDAREQRGDDPSDATWTVAREQAREAEPLDEVPNADRLELRTDENAVGRAWAWLVDRATTHD